MAFQKFAKASVLDFKWSDQKIASRSSFKRLADFSFNDYLTDDGYLYVRVRAISSRTNKNHDSWPSDELKKAYRTFIGKPLFVDHHNHNPKKARGIVVDAELHIEDSKTSSLDPYYAGSDVDPLHMPPTWVELLLEVDAKKFPKLAKAIISGDIDSVSMGADVGYTQCNICDNKAKDPGQFCKHIISKGAYFDSYKSDGTKTSKRSAEHCYKVSFFELSFVFDPADETALFLDVKSAKVDYRDKPKLKQIALAADMFAGEIFEPGSNEWEGPTPDEMGEAPVAGVEPGLAGGGRPSEDERVRQWRYEQFIQMGYPPAKAEQLAGGKTDWHDHENLLGNGATIDQTERILARVARVMTAENPIPQSDMTRMPEAVNTLRQEKVCQVCGSDMEDGECGLCGYTEPPEGFGNPDLEKAKEVDQQLHQDPSADSQEEPMDQQNEVENDEVAGASSTQAPTTASANSTTITSRTSAQQVQKKNPRINTQERPILPITRQNSDKPLAVRTLANPATPVQSKTREENMSTTKTADGASPQGEGTQAEKRVDVTGVGGVSGDPLTGITTENIETDTGDFTAPHTDTWSGSEGDSLGQQDAVTSEAFEGGGQGSGEATGVSSPGPGTLSNYQILAETNGPSSSGFPDHDPSRVDLYAPIQNEVGDRTKTWSDMTVNGLEETSPVKTGEGEDANSLGGPIGVAVASTYSHAVKAMKLAETEATMGLTADKWNRVAELESKSVEYIDAQLETLAKVKTANIQPRKLAGRMPSFRHVAAFDPSDHEVAPVETQDSIY